MRYKNIKAMLSKGRILMIQSSRQMKSSGGSLNNGYGRSYLNSRDLSFVPRVSYWLQRDRGGRGGDAQGSEARWCQHIHVPGLEFVRPRRRRPLCFYTSYFNLRRHEIGRVFHIQFDLCAGIVHCG